MNETDEIPILQIGNQVQSLLGLKPIMRLKSQDQLEQGHYRYLCLKSNQHQVKSEGAEDVKFEGPTLRDRCSSKEDFNNGFNDALVDQEDTFIDDIDDEEIDEDHDEYLSLNDAAKLVKVELGSNPIFEEHSIWDEAKSGLKNLTRKRRNARKSVSKPRKLAQEDTDDIEPVPKKRPGRKRTKHLDLDADPGSLACEECGRICPNRGAYLQHKETHNKTKDFICSHCGKGFKNDRYLQSHISYTHMGKTWVCDFCGKVFKQPSSWRLHKAQKHSTVPPRRPHCEHCGKTFMSNTTLKFHQAVVHQIGEYFQCTQCDRKYAAQLLLDEHVRTRHMGVKYPCAACGKIFHHRQTLKRHQVKNKCPPPDSNAEDSVSARNLDVAPQVHSNNNLNLRPHVEAKFDLKSQFDSQESHKKLI
ncbi:hypothetical protein TCAL_03812 [Tigriopus californicus]|uniref:C2H2-type domain-containing protein n=2 Tax=Tigriopus californicus TaxID=6832 RepID=A0A553NUB8_TIGCA|nr:hypothetical protein TCAL_03812 [Tigriopus californicus]